MLRMPSRLRARLRRDQPWTCYRIVGAKRPTTSDDPVDLCSRYTLHYLITSKIIMEITLGQVKLFAFHAAVLNAVEWRLHREGVLEVS